MKAIKVIGLAVLTALLAMSFVGATSAMAEKAQLCGHDGHPCEAVRHIHETSSVGGKEAKAVFLTSIGNTECNVLYLGDVTAYGEPIKIKGSFTYTNCVLGGSSCVITEENGPAELEVKLTAAEEAEVTGKYLFHTVCSGFIDCSYNSTGLKATAKGPLKSTQANGEVTLSEQATTKEAGGFLCPKTLKLDITTTPLWKVYFSKELLGYCVKTEHTTGTYTDEKCTTLGKDAKGITNHEWTYALVFETEGRAAGEVLCYGTLLKYGLYEERNKVTDACEKDDLRTPPESLYEKGTITLVE
jgi:hypothetical protein